MLVEFFDDLPSSVVLPCILSDYKGTLRDKSFVFKYLFILPDENGNVYGCAVSKNLEVCELFPKSVIRFDKILNESYDISEGFTDFEYSDTSLLYPVLASSVTVEDKRLESYAAGFGKDSDLAWIDNLFDVFSFNTNLVRSFISGDGTEINYVQESCELIVADSGTVEFKTSDDVGILLNEFLGSAFEIGGDLTFSDKIFSLKNIINRIAGKGSGMSFSLVGLNYDSDAETLKVYFKYTADGVFVFNSNFDAVFEIRNNELVYAKFIAAKCIGTETFTTVMPQKYASLSNNDTAGTPRVFLAMNMQDDGIRKVCWVNSSVSSEVNE